MLPDGKLMSGNLVQTSGQLIDGELYPRVIETGGGGSGGVDFTTDETLTLENGILSVNRATDVEQDNTLPITSAAVYETVGNINALLASI